MKQRIAALCALAAATALIIIGIVQNQPAAVWSKAIRICLECIGIG